MNTSGHTSTGMNTTEFLQYLLQNEATQELATNLASAYLQRTVVRTSTAA